MNERKKTMKYRILEIDPLLKDFEQDINLRMDRYADEMEKIIGTDIDSFANGYLYFGFHKQANGWIYREWAPNADEIHLIGDFNNWNRKSHKMTKLENGVFEIFLQGADALLHGSRVKIQINAKGKIFDRIPLYCKRVIQDPVTFAFDGQVWELEKPFVWTDTKFMERKSNKELPFIYECHIGMSSEAEGVATFEYFTEFVLPRIKSLGYNTIQLMAIMEHAYYASFGYQVTNFFSVSSRFGTPEHLKRLINTAHKMGIAVLLDIVHSHASSNSLDGMGDFDGSNYQFFHAGKRGTHNEWNSKLFNYGNPHVIHFLLSNIKFWLTEYHFDGFRFDGVTSMLYHNHGIGGDFGNYRKYFSLNTDVEAITYLQLATSLAKTVKPNCLLIAEDMSGMPGMCLPIEYGGIGFDYRLAMGMPDFWIRNLREKRDEDWNLGLLWHELTQRRPMEKVIGYCESHDQALVGDKTIMFWLADKEMYSSMSKKSQSHIIDRAISLHKLIRLITCICAGDGYLNFMGNEFGHPEWIDFPRAGNDENYHYARRQWSLADNTELRYGDLQNFDRDMVALTKSNRILKKSPKLILHREDDGILIFEKGDFLFMFNFHPTKPYTTQISERIACAYKVVLNSDWKEYGGYLTKQDIVYTAKKSGSRYVIETTVNNREVIVCKKHNEIGS